MKKSDNPAATGNVFTLKLAAYYPGNAGREKSNPAVQERALFDDGEIKVINIRGVHGLCEVTYFHADNPAKLFNSLFDEYGIDEQGYLGSFAIQQAVNLFYADRSAFCDS